jgi:uncharacterized membrane protein YbhN (UPF0104 family)
MSNVPPDSTPAPAPPPRVRGRVVRHLARFLVAAIGLWIIFRQVPPDEVMTVIRNAHWIWVLAGFIVAAGAQWLLAARMRVLTDAYHLRLRTIDVLHVNVTTRFYGLFLPGGGLAAGAVRVFRFARLQGDYTAGIAAVAFDRALTTAVQCLMGLAFGAFAWRPGQSPWLGLMALIAIGLTTPFVVLARRRGETHARSSRGGLLARKIEVLSAGISNLSGSDWRRLLGWSITAHLVGTLEYVLLARALDLDVGFATAGWVRAVMLTATTVPITVSGLGLREGAALLIFAGYGISSESALAFSLLVFVVSHLGIGLIGAFFEVFRRPS